MFSYLIRPRSRNQGFTLIELLVAIVIIGALSAIALPSYLNQVAKARGSEAKGTLGSINRAQQAYRYEEGSFAPNTTELASFGLKIPVDNYNYTITGTPNTATASADTLQTDLKVYASGVALGSNDIFIQGICESINVKGSASGNTATVTVSGGAAATVACSTGKQID